MSMYRQPLVTKVVGMLVFVLARTAWAANLQIADHSPGAAQRARRGTMLRFGRGGERVELILDHRIRLLAVQLDRHPPHRRYYQELRCTHLRAPQFELHEFIGQAELFE